MSKRKQLIKRIAVLISSRATSCWCKLEGIMTFAHTCPDWEITLVTSENVAEIRRTLRDVNPDGVIVTKVDEGTAPCLASITAPVVIEGLNSDDPALRDRDRTCFVTNDLALAGRKIARHAHTYGYRSFLCVGKAGLPWEKTQFNAFENELAKFDCNTRRLDAPFSTAKLLAALKSLPPHAAVFAADDHVAVDILAIARRNGFDVPHQFGIIGVGNYQLRCDNSHPPLTSLELRFAHGGYLAAQRLKTLLHGGLVPKVSFILPGSVCDRQSLPPIHAPRSLATDLAIAFIGQNAQKPIEVQDVVAAADVSRRSLENLFRRELSASIAEKIRDARLELLSRKIKDVDANLSDVCHACGWSHAAHAMRLFKRRFGVTMSEYRSNPPAT